MAVYIYIYVHVHICMGIYIRVCVCLPYGKSTFVAVVAKIQLKVAVIRLDNESQDGGSCSRQSR